MKPIPLALGEVANFGIAKLLFYVNMSAPNTHYTLPPLLGNLFEYTLHPYLSISFSTTTSIRMAVGQMDAEVARSAESLPPLHPVDCHFRHFSYFRDV